MNLQIFDALDLVRGRFTWNSMLPRFDDGLVQAFVAAVSIVALFSTVVGLDHNSV